MCSTCGASTGGMAARPSDCISGTVFGCYPVQGHTTNHARGLSLFGTTHQTSSRSCGVLFRFSSLVFFHHPVCTTCNTLLDRCVSGLLSLHNHRADALHFADQKFELVHQSSTTVLAQRCCEINSVADTSGTAVLNTQKLRQVVRKSRDVAVHVNVSYTRNGSAEKQLS